MKYVTISNAAPENNFSLLFMKISVIVPAYNEEKYIARTLESLSNQLEKPDEVIVVDNNSTDQTRQIVEKFPFVKILSESKQGMIHARNAGCDAAQSEIIARCDADTILPENWIAHIKQNFLTQPIDALSGPVLFNELQNEIPYASHIYFDFLKLIMKHHVLLGPNMAFTRKIWLKVRDLLCTEDKNVHEDTDLALHIHEVGGKITIDKELVVYTSARRIKNDPLSYFVEYPIRLARMLKHHNIKLIV